MKLSAETMSILQNFQSINPSIVINSNNILRTISPSETIFAKAIVPDTFPRKLGIYDLSKFLAILSLNKNSDVEFLDSHMVITQERSKVRYTYCNTDLIKTPPDDKEIVLPSVDVCFELKSDVLKEVLKAMSILGFNEICFNGDSSILSVQAINTKNESSDLFSTEIGTTDKSFSVVIESDKLKMIPGDYTVSITKDGIAHFRSEIVEYWVAISTKSVFH